METKEEGLVPMLLRKFKFRKQFTKKELEEIEKIKKQTFLFEMRRYAREEGRKMAQEEIKECKRRFKNV